MNTNVITLPGKTQLMTMFTESREKRLKETTEKPAGNHNFPKLRKRFAYFLKCYCCKKKKNQSVHPIEYTKEVNSINN